MPSSLPPFLPLLSLVVLCIHLGLPSRAESCLVSHIAQDYGLNPFICPLPPVSQRFIGYVAKGSPSSGPEDPSTLPYGPGGLLIQRNPIPMDLETLTSVCSVWVSEGTWEKARKVFLDLPEAQEGNGTVSGQLVADIVGLIKPPILAIPPSPTNPSPLLYIPHRISSSQNVRLSCHPKASGMRHSMDVEWSEELFRSAQSMRSRLIVAIGDLHGDFDSAMRTFRMAGVVDEKLHWAGGSEMIFVQTGDIVDRGPDTIRLYTTLERLRQEAEEAGGEVIQVLGNHELMNLAGDLRYVTPEDTASFGGAESRAAAFTPTGFIGRHLFPLDLVHRVDRTIFAHGGINEDWAKVGALEINEETHRELPKYAREKDLMKQWQGWPIFAETGPAWYRGFALDPEAVMCPRLRRALRRLGVERMVVGHTFQESGRILSRCGGRFIVIDVGISRAYGGFAAALHIHSNGTVKAIYPSGQVDHTMKKDRKG